MLMKRFRQSIKTDIFLQASIAYDEQFEDEDVNGVST